MCDQSRSGRLVTWIGIAWVIALTVLSFKLWGVVIIHTRWLIWAKAAGEALFYLPGLFFKYPGIPWGIVVLFAAALLGRSLSARILPEPPTLPLCISAGSSVLALAACGLGSAGLYTPPLLVGMTLFICVAGLADLLIARRRGHRIYPTVTRLATVEIVGLALAGTIVLITSVNPTLFYDALYYHLSLPQLYLFSGSTAPLSWHPFSYFPSNAEMLFGIALAGGNTVSAQVLLGGIWLCAMLMIRDLGVRFISPAVGGAVLLVSLCTLTFALSALLVTVDPLVLMLSMAGLFCLCAADRAVAEKDLAGMRSWLVLWAVMAGGAAGIKYTVWITCLGLQGIIAAWVCMKAGRPGLRQGAPALMLAFLVLMPWPLRNLIASGNPVMPVPIGSFFSGLPQQAWEVLKSDAHSVEWSMNNLAVNLASPWLMVFSDWETLVRKWGAARFVGPLIWMGAPLLLLFRNRPRINPIIWTYAIIATFISISSFHMIRFAYPGLGALAVLGGAGLCALREEARDKRAASIIFFLFIGAGVVLCLALLSRTTADITKGYRFSRLNGDLVRYMSDRARIDPREAGSSLFQLKANQVLSRDSVVLMVGEARSLYLDRLTIAPPFLSRNPLVDLLRHSSPGSVKKSLITWGVTHVLVSMPELDRMQQGYGLLGLTPELRERVNEFIHSQWCRPILENKAAGLVLCELESS